MLEVYLPRIMAAQSNSEYVETMKEAVALLADGYTSVQGERRSISLRIEPVQAAY
jgi:hypothetical protein